MEQKPQIPTLKDSQKPQVKIKGLQAGLSLIDRLKQFKKKDLAFISAGLGVLFMAPLAEHFMMSPEAGGGTPFREGWDFKGNSLGANASPYESGINGLAPGGVTGGGDIITPLNVRDPSSLIMGPGSQQQAPATAVAPPPPPSPAKEEWKDAYANAASRGVQEATKRAALPVPKPSLTNAGLRGLGAVAGGGGGSFTPGAISSQGLTGNRAADSNSLSRVSAAPGFRGVAGPRGSNNASAGSMEALKKASSGALDQMNRSGPSGSALEQAASLGMNGGSGAAGRGQGGEGKEDKGPGGNQDKNSMNVGESLEFMRMKAEQEKAIDLKWKLKEQQAMLWPDLKKKMLEELVMAPVKGLSAAITEAAKDFGSSKRNMVYKCQNGGPFPQSKVASSCAGEVDKSTQYCLSGSDIYRVTNGQPASAPEGRGCGLVPGDAESSSSNRREGPSQVAPPGSPVEPDGGVKGETHKLCEDMNKTPANEPSTDDTKPVADFKGVAEKLEKVAIATMEARKAMIPDAGPVDCGNATVKPIETGKTPLKTRLDDIDKKLKGDENAAFKLLFKSASNAEGTVAALEGKNQSEKKEIDALLVNKGTVALTEEAVTKTAATRIDKVQANMETEAKQGLADAAKYLEDAKTPLDEGIKGLDEMKGMLKETGDRLDKVKADYESVQSTVKLDAYKAKAPRGEGSMQEYAKTITARYAQEVKNYEDLRKRYGEAYVVAHNAKDKDGRVDQVDMTIKNIKFILKGNAGDGVANEDVSSDMHHVPGYVTQAKTGMTKPTAPTWAQLKKDEADPNKKASVPDALDTIITEKKGYIAEDTKRLTDHNQIVLGKAKEESRRAEKLSQYPVDINQVEQGYSPKTPMETFVEIKLAQ